jgi:translation initiation factor 1
LPPGEQTAYIARDRKGRGGKTVTVVRNLQLTTEDMRALGSQLRKACGAGGTVKDGVIEIQGDHREKVAAKLAELGYRVKFSGG